MNKQKTSNRNIKIRSTQKAKAIRSQQRHITLMLLAVAGVFLLLTFPNSIYFVLDYTHDFNKKPITNDYHQWLRYRRLKIVTILMFQLSDLQHATNIFIYLLTSNKFRQSVLNICASIVYPFSLLFTCLCRCEKGSNQNFEKRIDNNYS